MLMEQHHCLMVIFWLLLIYFIHKMKFWQKYQFDEYPFGIQTVIFAVSDSYNELFQNTGIQTDIYLLESVKKDLNTEEGSYAIDELPFSINQLACQTEDDLKAMYFVLDAANVKVNRYCAVFFGEELLVDNLLFIGKISSKITGEDEYWEGTEYEFNVNPKRVYKFLAHSFDISILEQVKLTGNIETLEGVPIANVYDRLAENNWQIVKQIFSFKPSYTYYNNYLSVWLCPLANLFDVLYYLYLAKASEIIQELTGTNILFYLVENTLGIYTSPVIYTLKDENHLFIKEAKEDRTTRTELRMQPMNVTGSAPYIHRKLIDPSLGAIQNDDEVKNQILSEEPFSFKSLDNVAELLFEISRSFACYIFITYTSATAIVIEFKSRMNLIENDYTYIIGAEDASFDTSSVIAKEANEFYGLANNLATDGFDEIRNKPNTSIPEPSQKFQDADKERKFKKEQKKIELKRLLLTTSPTLHTMVSKDKFDTLLTGTVPINTIPYEVIILSEQNNIDPWEVYRPLAYNNSAITERIHTGIYIIYDYNNTRYWRPASRIYAKINNIDLDFNTLTDYVNYVLARDKHYYETEYTLTIPSWNGFAKDQNGSNASWRNIKLGSKIKLAETVKRYNNGVWIDTQIQRDYVVVGIEINLQKPETKLKLHNIERFAFGYWDGNEEQLTSIIFSPEEISIPADQSVVIEIYEIDVNETILEGDAVMLSTNNNGKIAKSKSLSDYQNRTIGIAKASGNSGDKIPVQIGGRVYCNAYSFTNIGKQVYARTSSDPNNNLNITENILAEPTYTEDLIICLGKIDSEKSFILDINEFPFESGILQA